MEQTRLHYLAWLRDAHALEEQALTMLQGTASRLENYPLLRGRIQDHVRETEGQAAALTRLLNRQGADSSLVKDTKGKMLAILHAMAGVVSEDEVVKGVVASYAFEQLEIASYRVLITAAEQLGDAEAVEVFTRCLAEEEAMADWLADHSAQITRAFLSRAELDLPAQR